MNSDRLSSPSGIENPKGELQELLQARSTSAPEYQLISASGADHDRDFECAVSHDGVELARGRGKTKKAAEGDAAEAALKKLVGSADNLKPYLISSRNVSFTPSPGLGETVEQS